jgi:NADH dehydrogenase
VSERADKARPRVLVLGGGFAGIGAVQKLKKSDVDVVLVDKNDYHTFQPLLYQVATGLLEQPAVGHPIRDLVHGHDNTRMHKDRVTAVDLDAREVQFDALKPLSYDYLVFGLGAEVNFFGVDGAADHAFPLYTLSDAVRLKNHVLSQWEAADKDPALIEDGALNVVVVGGGPTGVETAGALAELYTGVFRRDYPDVAEDAARITLVEAGPEIFSMFKPDIRNYTVEALTKRGVEVTTGEVVESVTPLRVKLKSGKELKAHTLVWGAGLQGNALVQSLGLELERGGYRRTRRYLQWATSPPSPTRRPSRSCPSWARWRCSPVSTSARRLRASSRARTRSRSSTATRARWRRSDGARPSCR